MDINYYLQQIVNRISLTEKEILELETKRNSYTLYISDNFNHEVEFLTQGSFDNKTTIKVTSDDEIDIDTALILSAVESLDHDNSFRSDLCEVIRKKNTSMKVSDKNNCINVIYSNSANLDFSVKLLVNNSWYIILKNGEFEKIMNPKNIGEQLHNLTDIEKDCIKLLKFLKSNRIQIKSIQISALINNIKLSEVKLSDYILNLNDKIESLSNSEIDKLFSFNDGSDIFDYSEISGDKICYNALKISLSKLADIIINFENNTSSAEEYFGHKISSFSNCDLIDNSTKKKMYSDYDT